MSHIKVKKIRILFWRSSQQSVSIAVEYQSVNSWDIYWFFHLQVNQDYVTLSWLIRFWCITVSTSYSIITNTIQSGLVWASINKWTQFTQILISNLISYPIFCYSYYYNRYNNYTYNDDSYNDYAYDDDTHDDHYNDDTFDNYDFNNYFSSNNNNATNNNGCSNDNDARHNSSAHSDSPSNGNQHGGSGPTDPNRFRLDRHWGLPD